MDLNSSTDTIISMYSVEPLQQILLVTSNGKIMQLQIDLFHSLSVKNNKIEDSFSFGNDFNYYVHDLDLSLSSSILLPTRYDKTFDLWLGSCFNAEIFCFSLKSMSLTGSYLHAANNHYLTVQNRIQNSGNYEEKAFNVSLMRTTQTDTFFLWSYVYPGSTVYLWNHVSKKVMSAYNCLKAFEDLSFKLSRKFFSQYFFLLIIAE